MPEPTVTMPSEAPAPAPVPPPVAPPQKPSMLLAVLAGLVPVVAVPLGAVAFVLTAGEVRDAWYEGGAGMYAVTLSLVAGAVLLGVALMLAGRVWAPAALAVPFFVALPALVGRAFTSRDLGSAVEAVMHASPVDRATILFAALAEALWPTIFGGLSSFALALPAALGLALAALARRKDAATGSRNALAVAAPAAVLIGLTALAASGLAHAWADPFRAVAHASPSDVIVLLSASLEDVVPWERARLALAVLAAAATLGGALVVRRSGGAALTVALASLVTLGLVWSLARVAFPSGYESALSQSTEHPALLVVDAPLLRGAVGALVTDQPPVDFVNAVREMRELHGSSGIAGDLAVPVGLAPDASATALEATLRLAAENGATEVLLLVDGPKDSKGLPPLRPPFDALTKGTRGVTVGLGSTQRLCGESCEGVALEADALVVGGERWPLEEDPLLTARYDARDAVVMLKAFDPKQVVLAAMTAAAHQRRLAFAIDGLPDSAPEPERAEEAPPETPAPPPGVVTIARLAVQGPLDPKTFRKALQEQLPALAECTARLEEPHALPVTRRLQLAVLSTGEVSSVVAVSDVPEAQLDLEDCLEWRLKDLELSPHSPKGVSVVSVDLAITEQKASEPAKKK